MHAFRAGVLLLLSATAAGAQEVGVFASAARSEHEELRRPTGVGAFAAVTPLPFLSLRGTYQEQSYTRDHSLTVCDTYWPEFENCVQEGVEQGARLSTWSAAALLRVRVAGRMYLEVGGGPSRSRVRGIARTESGRGLGHIYPEGEQDGVVMVAGTVVERPLGVPVSASVEATRSRVDFTGCATDVGTPFCGTARLTEVRIGLRYRFFRFF